MTTEHEAEGKDEDGPTPAAQSKPPATPTKASNDRPEPNPRDANDVDEEEEEEEEETEPKLKYSRLTASLGPVYRNGDATSSSLVAGDKMVAHPNFIHARKSSRMSANIVDRSSAHIMGILLVLHHPSTELRLILTAHPLNPDFPGTTDIQGTYSVYHSRICIAVSASMAQHEDRPNS